VASGFAINRFYLIEVANKTGYWPTYPITDLNQNISSYLISMSSIVILPVWG
jgi:hypothetical protein